MRHRSTTAHVASAYPWQAERSVGPAGVWLGTDVLAGGAPFCFDPFAAYTAGIVTNPNVLVAGEPGVGKSAAVKTLLHRSATVLGRRVLLADPKGEYGPLARTLGLSVVRLAPGGSVRVNPLEQGPASTESVDERARRQAVMASALVSTVLRRELLPVEDAALGWALAELASERRQPTLGDLAARLADPSPAMADRARLPGEALAHAVEAATYALGKLLDRSLRGMFDGQTTARVDWDGPGVVVDLSAVHADGEALGVVLVAATAWLQTLLARGGGGWLQVLDEAWALLSSERTARYLQACWKLCRAYGVANVAVVHRLSDLRAQADDGTAAAKVAAGLLADTQTRVLFRQAADQVADARGLLGLTSVESALLPRLARGRALWHIGARAAVVQHHVATCERRLCDTDGAMR